MKVFWLDCGIHVEPETPEETRALIVLWDGIRKEISVAPSQKKAVQTLGSARSEPSDVGVIADP